MFDLSTIALFTSASVLLALAPGALVIVMSSIPVDTAAAQAQLCAERGLRYLQLAQGKDPRSPKVLSARELYRQIARKYGIDTPRPATGSRE